MAVLCMSRTRLWLRARAKKGLISEKGLELKITEKQHLLCIHVLMQFANQYTR